MPEGVAAPAADDRAGLCATCRHARRITSDRGSIFVLCTYSSIDRAFPKYPRLPMRVCRAYARNDDDLSRS